MSTKTPAKSEPLTPPRPFVEFGRVLTELRKEARFRKTDLAHECEVSWQTVGRWEIGRMLPTYDNRVRIAHALRTVRALPKDWKTLRRSLPARKSLLHKPKALPIIAQLWGSQR
jgi:DNA-binding XRE family transcriptional regulator